MDRANIVSDVFTSEPITASRCTRQHTINIKQAYCNPIYFGLAAVFEIRLRTQTLFDSGFEILKVLLIKNLVQREHWLLMGDLGELRKGL